MKKGGLVAKGKYKTLKSFAKKKKKNAFKHNTSQLPWKKPKEKGMLVSMPTDVLIVWFATLPMCLQVDATRNNARAFGREMLDFAESLPSYPGGEKQRKFIIFIVFIVAHIMKIEELLEDTCIVWCTVEFEELVNTINSEHFRNTVLFDMEMYMLFISRFLPAAGVLDINSALESARKREEML